MRRRIMSSVGSKALPYLRRVAYLESHGTEYIDTGVVPTKNDGMSFLFSNLLFVNNDFNFIGCRSANKRFMVNSSNGFFGSGYCIFNVTTIPIEFSSDRIYSVKQNFLNDKKFVVQGYASVNLTESDLDISSSCLIFSQGGGVFSRYQYRIYEFSMSRFEDVIINLIPVLDLSGRPAMYDEVSGRFFYNQGIGEFTWGELNTASDVLSREGGGY